MQKNIKKLPKGEIEIACVVALDEIKALLEKAAQELTEEKPIDGFRPGKTPYDVVKQRYGEMAIYETAMPDIVRKAYVEAVRGSDLDVFGEPRLDVKKLAPGNDVEFTLRVAIVPKVTSLPDLKTIRIGSKAAEIKEAEVDEALKQLQKMRTKEALAAREVRGGDKIVVDMDMSLAGVPLEGGQTRGHGIYLEEEYYVPGLKEQLLGLKTGEQKKFALKFPETHYQKNIAGKDVEFSVTVKSVFELSHPALDDEFAKGLGRATLPELRDLIKTNMAQEAADKEARRAENEAIEKIVERSRFDDVPDLIINQETDRMMHELVHELTDRGVQFENYLKNIKKTADDLKLDFAPQAVKRVKAALAMREIGQREKLDPTEKEVSDEQTRLMNEYTDDAEAQTRIRGEEMLDYIRATIRNRKVAELIRKTCVETE